MDQYAIVRNNSKS